MSGLKCADLTHQRAQATRKGWECHLSSLIFLRVMSTSKRPLKVSDERIQMYLARRNQYLCTALTDGDYEQEVDPYAFEEGDVKFTFSNKKDKTGGEREPGKKNKVSRRHECRLLATPYLMLTIRLKAFLLCSALPFNQCANSTPFTWLVFVNTLIVSATWCFRSYIKTECNMEIFGLLCL